MTTQESSNSGEVHATHVKLTFLVNRLIFRNVKTCLFNVSTQEVSILYVKIFYKAIFWNGVLVLLLTCTNQFKDNQILKFSRSVDIYNWHARLLNAARQRNGNLGHVKLKQENVQTRKCSDVSTDFKTFKLLSMWHQQCTAAWMITVLISFWKQHNMTR